MNTQHNLPPWSMNETALHNPNKLTAETVGENFRLLLPYEVDGRFGGKCQLWHSDGGWSTWNANGAEKDHTYRVPLVFEWPDPPTPKMEEKLVENLCIRHDVKWFGRNTTCPECAREESEPLPTPPEDTGGPEASDGHDHEGFEGGCVRAGHTPETCPLLVSDQSGGKWAREKEAHKAGKGIQARASGNKMETGWFTLDTVDPTWDTPHWSYRIHPEDDLTPAVSEQSGEKCPTCRSPFLVLPCPDPWHNQPKVSDIRDEQFMMSSAFVEKNCPFCGTARLEVEYSSCGTELYCADGCHGRFVFPCAPFEALGMWERKSRKFALPPPPTDKGEAKTAGEAGSFDLRRTLLDLLERCFEDEKAHLELRLIRDAQAPRFEALQKTHPEIYADFMKARTGPHEVLLRNRRERVEVLTRLVEGRPSSLAPVEKQEKPQGWPTLKEAKDIYWDHEGELGPHLQALMDRCLAAVPEVKELRERLALYESEGMGEWSMERLASLYYNEKGAGLIDFVADHILGLFNERLGKHSWNPYESDGGIQDALDYEVNSLLVKAGVISEEDWSITHLALESRLQEAVAEKEMAEASWDTMKAELDEVKLDSQQFDSAILSALGITRPVLTPTPALVLEMRKERDTSIRERDEARAHSAQVERALREDNEAQRAARLELASSAANAQARADKLKAEVEEANKKLSAVVEAAESVGWNGVENSKILAEFIKDMGRARDEAHELLDKACAANQEAMKMADKELSALRQELEQRKGDEWEMKRIAVLIGQIYFYGKFKAETAAESELESLLRKRGYFFEDEDTLMRVTNALGQPLPTTQEPSAEEKERAEFWDCTDDVPKIASVWLRSKGDYRAHMIVGFANPNYIIMATCGSEPVLESASMNDHRWDCMEWSYDRKIWKPCHKAAKESARKDNP